MQRHALRYDAAAWQERTEQRYFAARAARTCSAPRGADSAAQSLLWRLCAALLPTAAVPAESSRRTSGVQTLSPARAAAAALGQSHAGEASSEGDAASDAADESQASELGEEGEVGDGAADAHPIPGERSGDAAPWETRKDQEKEDEEEPEEEDEEEEENEEQGDSGRCAALHALRPFNYQRCSSPGLPHPKSMAWAVEALGKNSELNGDKQDNGGRYAAASACPGSQLNTRDL